MNRMDALKDVRRTVHERLIGRVDARQLDAMPRAERRLRVREEALSLLREQGHMLPQSALADVVNAVSDAVVGMGPIEFLLKDPEITEVMVNGPDDVYVERKGRIERVADRLFEGEEAVLHVIERIVAPLGLRVDAPSPCSDARLPDGSRVQTRFLSHDETAGHSVMIRGSRADGPRGEPHTEVDRPWTTLRTSVWTCTRTRSPSRSCGRSRTSPTTGSSRTRLRRFANLSAVGEQDWSPATRPVPPATRPTGS